MRRVKIAYVLPEDIVQAFLYRDTGFPTLKEPHSTNVLRRLRLVGVPPDATIDGHVQYDFSRQCFALLVEHPSFDPVPHGEVPPTIVTAVDVILCDHEGREIKPRPSDVVPDLMAKHHVGSYQHRDLELRRLKAINNSGQKIYFPLPERRGCETPEPEAKADNPFDKTWRDRPSLL